MPAPAKVRRTTACAPSVRVQLCPQYGPTNGPEIGPKMFWPFRSTETIQGVLVDFDASHYAPDTPLMALRKCEEGQEWCGLPVWALRFCDVGGASWCFYRATAAQLQAAPKGASPWYVVLFGVSHEVLVRAKPELPGRGYLWLAGCCLVHMDPEFQVGDRNAPAKNAARIFGLLAPFSAQKRPLQDLPYPHRDMCVSKPKSKSLEDVCAMFVELHLMRYMHGQGTMVNKRLYACMDMGMYPTELVCALSYFGISLPQARLLRIDQPEMYRCVLATMEVKSSDAGDRAFADTVSFLATLWAKAETYSGPFEDFGVEGWVPPPLRLD